MPQAAYGPAYHRTNLQITFHPSPKPRRLQLQGVVVLVISLVFLQPRLFPRILPIEGHFKDGTVQAGYQRVERVV